MIDSTVRVCVHYRYNDPTVCVKGSHSTLYATCNEGGTLNAGSSNVNGKCGSPGPVRAATLPRNVYHSPSSTQLVLRNDEAVTSFSANHNIAHHFNVSGMHAVSIAPMIINHYYSMMYRCSRR